MKIYTKRRTHQFKTKYNILCITAILVLSLVKNPVRAYENPAKRSPDTTSGNSFYGIVQLQSRSNHQDTRVFLTEDPCPSTYQPTRDTLPTQHTALTDDSGYFIISPYPSDRPYTFRCLKAVHDGFLVAEIRAPQVGDRGTVTLVVGDINFDNCINIFDLSYIASRYGTNDPTADLNVDEHVDIFDLSLIASNYGEKGPILDWR